MFDIITIGSSTRDVLIKSEDFTIIQDPSFDGGQAECLPLGSKIEIKDLHLTTGGGGSNTAVTFAKQGFNTACVGVIGKGINGQEIIAELKKEGVNTEFFQKSDNDHTAYSTILVHPSGERTILSYKGEGQHFDVNKLPFSEFVAKWIYIDSIGGYYDLFEKLVDHAVTNNIKLACNPGGKEIEHGLEKLKPILKHIDIYITNKEEGEELLWGESKRPKGSAVPSESTRRVSAEKVAQELKKYISGIISVSDGHNGVVVIDEQGQIYTAGVPDSPVVERTGAGDAFGSGFVCEYIRSGNIEKAIQFATANASSVVTQFGGKAGILKKDDWGPWPLVAVATK